MVLQTFEGELSGDSIRGPEFIKNSFLVPFVNKSEEAH